MNDIALENSKILIVDDERMNTEVLVRLLALAGFTQSRIVNDSREALSAFQEFHPDLVILDLAMPYLDGFEVLQQLQSAISGETFLPVLVLTAEAGDRAKERALSAGASDFVTKSFNNPEIILRVRNLLRTRRLQMLLEEHNEQLESTVAQRTAELRESVVELQATQEQRIQEERLRALGTMASGVAHDFNNALSIILGFSEFVLHDCQQVPAMKAAGEQMKIIITAAEDAAKIVERLKEFHRTDVVEAELPVDLNVLIEQALTFTRPRRETHAMRAGMEIEIRRDLQNIPLIAGYAAELREVLINLIFNALDAMPEGGTLAFRTCAEENGILLALSDTGTGMTEEVRRRCLEPFFTTKGERGSGLGLSMVYGIMQRHKGKLDIQSAPGSGTTFYLRFPPLEPSASTPLETLAQNAERPLRILVIDDQEVIRQIVADHLRNDLHTVETAAEGSEALASLQDTEFDVVITDHALPGMSGDQLARAIKAVRPSTEIILLTGFGEADDIKPEGVDLVVAKPVSQSTLRSAIRKVAGPR